MDAQDMRQKRAEHITRKLFAVLVVLTLMFSFGLHDVQLEHTHYHTQAGVMDNHAHQSEFSLAEYVHATLRKDLIVFVLAVFFFTAVLGLRQLHFRNVRFLWNVSCAVQIFSYRVFDFYQHIFRRGILHPKLH